MNAELKNRTRTRDGNVTHLAIQSHGELETLCAMVQVLRGHHDVKFEDDDNEE
jgi:hypothetical protein